MHAPWRPPTTQMCIWNASGKSRRSLRAERRDPAAPVRRRARLAGGALSCCSRACSSPLMLTARAIVASMRRLSRALWEYGWPLIWLRRPCSRSSDPLIPLPRGQEPVAVGGVAADHHWFRRLRWPLMRRQRLASSARALATPTQPCAPHMGPGVLVHRLLEEEKGTSLIFPKTSRVTSEVPFSFRAR